MYWWRWAPPDTRKSRAWRRCSPPSASLSSEFLVYHAECSGFRVRESQFAGLAERVLTFTDSHRAGVIGLTTALRLAEEDQHKITVVANHLVGDDGIDYASQHAGATFFPCVLVPDLAVTPTMLLQARRGL